MNKKDEPAKTGKKASKGGDPKKATKGGARRAARRLEGRDPENGRLKGIARRIAGGGS